LNFADELRVNVIGYGKLVLTEKMTKRFSAVTLQIFLLSVFLGLSSLSVRSQSGAEPFSLNESPLPAPTSPVMDYVGVLDAGTKQALEQRIIAFRDSTNPRVELAVAIVATTGERAIFDYSLAVSRGWKIGSPEQDNPSALLFIAVSDRKYFTQVSKDLEDELPDALVGQLQRQHLVPSLRQQNYNKAVTDTIEAYISTIKSRGIGEQAAPPTGTTRQQPRQNRGSISICGIIGCLAILFFVIVPLLGRFGSKRGRGGDDDHWRGGGFGGGASAALPWIIGSVIANSGSGSSSGGWGGSSGGGGDSWGGFGGGGDFGGGGAGGDW
jgi:uncharacterized protein